MKPKKRGHPLEVLKRLVSIKLITCTGCKDNQPGQLAHTVTGGCLRGTDE